jgi:hypothetical protein
MKKKTAIKPTNIVRKKRSVKSKIEPKKSLLDKASLWVYSKLSFIFGK